MAKYVNTDVFEDAVDNIISSANYMVITGSDILVDGIPDYDSVSAAALCDNISINDWQLTKTVYDTYVTLKIAEQEDVELTASGTTAYVLLLDTINERVLVAETTESDEKVSGQSVYIPPFSVTMGVE